MGRKHKKDISKPIRQFEGNATNDTEDIDEVYMNTEEYWKTGLVDNWVPIYQDWLGACKIIDESDLDEEDKKNEKDVLRRCKVRSHKNGGIFLLKCEP